MTSDSDPTPGPVEPADDPQKAEARDAAVTKSRKTLWIVGIGIGVYMIGRGIWMAVTGQP